MNACNTCGSALIASEGVDGVCMPCRNLAEGIPWPGDVQPEVDDSPAPSAVTQDLVQQILQRDAHGRAKYGVTLDRGDLTLSDWLQHMAEELMDGAGYALAAKRDHREEMIALVNRCSTVIGDAGTTHGFVNGVKELAAMLRSELSK